VVERSIVDGSAMSQCFIAFGLPECGIPRLSGVTKRVLGALGAKARKWEGKTESQVRLPDSGKERRCIPRKKNVKSRDGTGDTWLKKNPHDDWDPGQARRGLRERMGHARRALYSLRVVQRMYVAMPPDGTAGGSSSARRLPRSPRRRHTRCRYSWSCSCSSVRCCSSGQFRSNSCSQSSLLYGFSRSFNFLFLLQLPSVAKECSYEKYERWRSDEI
jgi:hypothetical protein